MAGSKDCLKDRLSHYRRIKISVIGRNFGRTISIPVWFVLQWYKNVLLNPQTRLEARGARRPVAAPPAAWRCCQPCPRLLHPDRP
jgi:hypothetical protein